MIQTVFTLLVVIACTLHTGSAFSSSGPSGEKCGQYGRCRAWPYSSTCNHITNKCKCVDPTSDGFGQFMCHYPWTDPPDGGEPVGEYFCAAFNDPEIVRYDGTVVNIPLSCKTILTAVDTPICVRSGDNFTPRPDVGTCKVRIFAWGKTLPDRGKTFIVGVQANFVLEIDGVTIYQNYRIYGGANKGDYYYTFDGNQNPSGFGGPWSTGGNLVHQPPYGSIEEIADYVNNFASIYADLCGVKVGLRVPDRAKPRDQAPGVYVKVHSACDPVFPDVPGKIVLCGLPTGGNTLDDFVNGIFLEFGKKVTKEVATMFAILISDVPQDFPGASQDLQTAVDIASECDMRTLICGIENCMAFLDLGFQRCFLKYNNNNTNNNNTTTDEDLDAIKQFSDCIAAYCLKSAFLCEDVQGRITESGCDVALDGVPSIWDEDCFDSDFFIAEGEPEPEVKPEAELPSQSKD